MTKIINAKAYKFLLWKTYFDKGFSLTNYFKYVLLLFGWGTGDVKTTTLIGIIWVIFCFILGWTWFKFKLIDTEIEVQNQVNPFVKEMRALSGGNIVRGCEKHG